MIRLIHILMEYLVLPLVAKLQGTKYLFQKNINCKIIDFIFQDFSLNSSCASSISGLRYYFKSNIAFVISSTTCN